MSELVATRPIAGQQPGTSGLCAKPRVFMQPGYLENFIQSGFNALDGVTGSTLVVGGDGRIYNQGAIQIILQMAAGNGAARVVVGHNGLLSTPAASAVIRARQCDTGIILSASHNPGGDDGDFGVKFNMANGEPAPEAVTNAIYDDTTMITSYRLHEAEDVALSTVGETPPGQTIVEVIDSVDSYAGLMRTLFDYDAIRAFFAGGFTIRLDAIHAVTGPYAKAILEEEIAAAEGTVINVVPRPDFSGEHPDPNLVHAHELITEMFAAGAFDFGAASDGDGDRYMLVGQHCYETLTGWKLFGNLLDAGLATLSGEKSFRTSSNHVREKDGLWAVLCEFTGSSLHRIHRVTTRIRNRFWLHKPKWLTS